MTFLHHVLIQGYNPRTQIVYAQCILFESEDILEMEHQLVFFQSQLELQRTSKIDPSSVIGAWFAGLPLHLKCYTDLSYRIISTHAEVP